MKKLLYLTAVLIALIGCSKGETADDSTIYGMYNSQAGDTVTVSQGYTANRLWMRFAYKNPVALRVVFDSVVLNADYTFTINEIGFVNNNQNQPVRLIGGGAIGTNVLSLNFSENGVPLSFNCIKKQ